MLEPKLLMLDEPSQGLSPKVATEIYEKLGATYAGGTSILLVEQSVAAALKYTSRAYVFERGRISLEGTSAEFQDNDEVRRTYLGVLTHWSDFFESTNTIDCQWRHHLHSRAKRRLACA